MIRFKKKSKIFDIVITALAGMCSVGVTLYGVWHFGLEESYEELVLNVFYLACLVMMWMYFFNRLEAQRFNYWCSVCVGITVLLRDILFPPPLAFQPLQLACLTLSVLLLLMLTYFYARKDWQSYTPSATFGQSSSSTCSLPHSTTTISIWNPSTNIPIIC